MLHYVFSLRTSRDIFTNAAWYFTHKTGITPVDRTTAYSSAGWHSFDGNMNLAKLRNALLDTALRNNQIRLIDLYGPPDEPIAAMIWCRKCNAGEAPGIETTTNPHL